jgi:hypothetical protein
MAVDVEDFEGFHEAIARKFKIDAFMLTCWDEDKERDTVLTDENLVKVAAQPVWILNGFLIHVNAFGRCSVFGIEKFKLGTLMTSR